MSELSRTGAFWDAMEGRVPPPPAAATAFPSGELRTEAGELVATATATARIISSR